MVENKLNTLAIINTPAKKTNFMRNKKKLVENCFFFHLKTHLEIFFLTLVQH